MKYSLASVFVMAVFGLFACNLTDKTTSPAISKGETGTARIQLPAAPAAFLAKGEEGSQLLFVLRVTQNHGSIVEVLRKTWTLSSDSEQTVTLSGIPAGIHFFEGSILEIKDLEADTLVTHRGGDSALIVASRTTDIRLYLGRVRDGEARICLEVEGWATHPDCIPEGADYAGCWALNISGSDTLPRDIQARLRLEIKDTMVTAFLAWNQNAEDTAYGTLVNGLLYLGENNDQPFRIKGSAYGGIFRGDISSPRLNAPGFVRGIRGDCESVSVPLIPNYAGCWDVIVKDYSGDTLSTGGMQMIQKESAITSTLSLGSGFEQSTEGFVNGDGVLFLGNSNAPFQFKGILNASGVLNGSYSNSVEALMGLLEGQQAVCPAQP